LIFSLERLITKVCGRLNNATQRAYDLVKLGRTGLFPSFLEAPMIEPNIGPFPQYNIIFEDEPMEDLIATLHRTPRTYKSSLREKLVKELDRANKALIETRSVLVNPRTQAGKSTLNKLRAGMSLLQDYEQFVEDNNTPFQEIFIKAASDTPVGGDVDLLSLGNPKVLDINRTAELLILQTLEVQEALMLNELQKIAKGDSS
jgi:hypothetical protein